jgi:hypothetical protein
MIIIVVAILLVGPGRHPRIQALVKSEAHETVERAAGGA